MSRESCDINPNVTKIMVTQFEAIKRFEKRSKNLKPRLKRIQQVRFPCLYRIVRVCTELSSALSLIKDLYSED